MADILSPRQIGNFAANRHPESINTQPRRDTLRETITEFSHDMLKAFAEHLDEIHGGEPFAVNEINTFIEKIESE